MQGATDNDHTIDFSINKRLSHNYSMNLGYGYTWQHDYPATYPNTPNGPFDYDYSSAGFKMNATYNAPYGILFSGLYRYQLGSNYGRTIAPGAAQTACSLPDGTVGACTYSAQRGCKMCQCDRIEEITTPADSAGDKGQAPPPR